MATVTHKGNPVATCGELPAVGTQAPDFLLTTTDLRDVSLADFRGQVKVLNIYPSVDTGTCAKSTREFNRRAAANPHLVVLNVSADLPFAHGRFCGAEGIDKVQSLSMMRSRDFARAYGVELLEGKLKGLTARAVVVIDENDRVVYTELVPEIAQEPNYDAALAAANGKR